MDLRTEGHVQHLVGLVPPAPPAIAAGARAIAQSSEHFLRTEGHGQHLAVHVPPAPAAIAAGARAIAQSSEQSRLPSATCSQQGRIRPPPHSPLNLRATERPRSTSLRRHPWPRAAWCPIFSSYRQLRPFLAIADRGAAFIFIALPRPENFLGFLNSFMEWRPLSSFPHCG